MSQSALARPNDDKKVVTIEISCTYAGVTQSGSRELHKTLQTLFGDPFITLWLWVTDVHVRIKEKYSAPRSLK